VTAGQLIGARGAVETGLALGAQAGHCRDSELHRLQSEPVLNAGGSTAEAEEFLPPRDRNRARSWSEVLRVAPNDQPRAPVARPGQTRCRARPPCPTLRLVHRRLRHRRPEGRQVATGGASGAPCLGLTAIGTRHSSGLLRGAVQAAAFATEPCQRPFHSHPVSSKTRSHCRVKRPCCCCCTDC
jgi:hypothetical protein